MTNKSVTPQSGIVISDHEQRLQVLATLLTWTAEELTDLGDIANAKTIEAVRDKMASKVNR